jgi:hypothetical protein
MLLLLRDIDEPAGSFLEKFHLDQLSPPAGETKRSTAGGEGKVKVCC